MAEFPEVIGQGLATEVEPGSVEEAKDELGYTNPTLHRRITVKNERIAAREPIDGQPMYVVPGKLGTNDYWVALESVDSYRTTEYYEHTEIEGSPFENEIP